MIDASVHRINMDNYGTKMSNSNHVGVTKLDNCQALVFQNDSIINQYKQIIGRLGAQSTAGLFFAEPALGPAEGNTYKNISWYTSYPGEDKPSILELPKEQRLQAEQHLRHVLDSFRPLLADPEISPLISRALLIPNLEDVKVIAGNPVLVNWGFVPADIDTSIDALNAHFKSVYGAYFDGDLTAALDEAQIPEPAINAGMATPASAMGLDNDNPEHSELENSTVIPTANTTETLTDNQPGTTQDRPSRKSWYFESGFIALVIVIVLFLGTLLGWYVTHRSEDDRKFPEGVDELEAQQALNESLRRERDRLRGVLEGEVCALDTQQLINPTLAPIQPAEGEPPKIMGGKEGEQPVLPPAPSGGSVADMLENGVAMILAPQKKGASMGSGFFISADKLVTNLHVIKGADPAGLYVVSEKIGKLIKAKVVATAGKSNIGGRDYAILQLESPQNVNPLVLTPTAKKLSQVYTGGYPGFITKIDPKLDALLKGDVTAAPKMVMSSGEISVEYTAENGIPIVVHTADISQGNSGGPLVDKCGRVIGINTFISDDPKSGRRGLFSLSSKDVIKFLTEQNEVFRQGDGTCQI